jgi:hypothetical protein
MQEGMLLGKAVGLKVVLLQDREDISPCGKRLSHETSLFFVSEINNIQVQIEFILKVLIHAPLRNAAVFHNLT